jgi:carboxyl-terminal processing protease
LIRKRVVLAILLVSLFTLGWFVGRSRATGDLYGNVDLFVEIIHKVEQNYVDPVESEHLVNGALKGMMRTLDPYSQYLDAKAFTNLRTTTQGQFGGIGVVVSVRDNYPTVISPIEGSPASLAGLRSGDQIVKIDGKSSAGLSIDEAADRLRGPEGTQVTVTVRREGEEEERNVALERKVIVTHSVPYSFVVGKDVGYVRLSSFAENSGAEVRAALDRLRKEGAKSAVLDLRQDPGGLLEQAVDVAGQFLPKGTQVVQTRGRMRGQDQRYYTTEAGAERNWPLVVLVDQGSASASEIVAGALQDLDRALLIGRTTFGKGLVQSVFPLRGTESALKLTTARYYTPSGRSINRAAHDTLSADEEEEADVEPVAPADTTPAPKFRTAGGRTVYGGGGITPDLVVLADSLPPLALDVERRGLPFRFANRWVNTHPGFTPGKTLPDPMWSEFQGFLTDEKVKFDAQALARETETIQRALRRELARRVSGDAAAARVALEGDVVFARALQVLSRVKTAPDVFAAGGLEAPRGTSRAATGSR